MLLIKETKIEPNYNISIMIYSTLYLCPSEWHRVFTNGPGDLSSIPGRVIPKTQKIVLDAFLLNTQHYKVWINGKVEQSRERSSAFPLHFSVVAIEKRTFWSPSTTVANFTLLCHTSCIHQRH